METQKASQTMGQPFCSAALGQMGGWECDLAPSLPSTISGLSLSLHYSLTQLRYCPPFPSLHRDLVPGHTTTVWYQPNGTRVVSKGHTLVSPLMFCFWPGKGGMGNWRGSLGGSGRILCVFTSKLGSWVQVLLFPES